MTDPWAEPARLEVYGAPEPQGNKTGFVRNGRVVMVEGRRPDSRERFKSWRDAVAREAREWQERHEAPLLDEACRLTCTFRLPRPKSIPKKRTQPTSRPDVDKLARAVGDALKGLLYSDDSKVCELVVRKVYAVDVAPGATIVLERMNRAGDISSPSPKNANEANDGS